MKRKLCLLFAVLGAGALAVTRVYHYQNWIDPTSCVYLLDSPWVLLPWGIFLLSAISISVFSLIEGKNLSFYYPGGRQIVSALAVFILIIAVGISTYTQISEGFLSDYSNLFAVILYGLFTIGCLVGLGGIFVSLLIPKMRGCSPIFGILPIPFFVIRLLFTYFYTLPAGTVAEFPWIMCMLSAECIFLVIFCRRATDFGQTGYKLSALFSGLCFLLTAASSATRFYLYWMNPERISLTNRPSLVDAAFFILSLTELASLAFGRNNQVD